MGNLEPGFYHDFAGVVGRGFCRQDGDINRHMGTIHRVDGGARQVNLGWVHGLDGMKQGEGEGALIEGLPGF